METARSGFVEQPELLKGEEAQPQRGPGDGEEAAGEKAAVFEDRQHADVPRRRQAEDQPDPGVPTVRPAGSAAPAPAQEGTLAERMEAYEGRIIRESYRRWGTTVAVARELGISQATAARKIAKYVK